MFDCTQYHVFDGAMGTSLQKRGLQSGQCPEKLNLTDPDTILSIHRSFLEAGSDVVTTNTFGASRRKLGEDPTPYIQAGVSIAKKAAEPYGGYTALDVGPLGGLLKPFGDMEPEDAYAQFAEIVEAGAAAGADLILIETMSDILEAKMALLAAKEHAELPVIVTMTYGEDGRTFLGTDPAAATVALAALRPDGVGVNCSLGPAELYPVVERIVKATNLPVLVQPNAGLPRLENGETVFDVGAEEFSRWTERFLNMGVTLLGGCCGTTPEHIQSISRLVRTKTSAPHRERIAPAPFCGWQGTATVNADSIVTVGERINPTGREKLKAALYTEQMDYVEELAIRETGEGADFLVVNAGLPDIDEGKLLPIMVEAIQRVSPLPLVIDCSDPSALEKALRVCRGRPILNSVNGSPESMAAMLPLARKYGTGLIVLALDENGVSDKAEERCKAAFCVAKEAEDMGIPREDIFIDCLSMAASVCVADAMETPKAIAMVRAAGYKTILGVSNVSHGLPGRDALNCAYLTLCLQAGLNIAIVNTSSEAVMNAVAAGRLLRGTDYGCAGYIQRFSNAAETKNNEKSESLISLIISGQKGKTGYAARELLEKITPLEVINAHIIPALDQVGDSYEAGRLFLPQLMASAEAVKAAFAEVDRHMAKGDRNRGTIVLATVKGDVHDIGKNIVKMLLENYGYRVVDLGRDVSPEEVVEAALNTKAPLVGLSSLMTTTAQNIAITIRALREAGATCKVMVGGAVVTPSFAEQIGADFYVKDAAQSAKAAAEVFEGKR